MVPCLLAFLAACGTEPGDSALPLVPLEGSVVDPFTAEAVDGAWVIVDDGVDLISARTGGDGTFSIPDVPAGVPLSLTFAAEGRTALTAQQVVLAEGDEPMVIDSLVSRDPADFAGDPLDIDGTLTGAPVGSYVMLYGENAYLGYVQVPDDAPVPFSVEATRERDMDTYTLSAVAVTVVGQDYTVEAVGVATVADGESPEIPLSTDLVDLEILTNRPTLDGDPVEDLEPAYCINLASTTPAATSQAVLGWNQRCESTDSGFSLLVRGLLPDPSWVGVYLGEDIEAGDLAYGVLPVSPGTTSLSVDLLDSPALSTRGEFAPGTPVSWTPPEGDLDVHMTVTDADGYAWFLFSYGDPTLTFPRLPDEFDPSLLTGAEATWYVGAYDYATVDDTYDWSQPYLASISRGGAVTP